METFVCAENPAWDLFEQKRRTHGNPTTLFVMVPNGHMLMRPRFGSAVRQREARRLLNVPQECP